MVARRPSRIAGAVAATLALAAPAAADEQMAAYLAGTCNTCHHGGGQGAAIPALAGRDAAELIGALRDYRSGTRQDALMQAVANALSEAEASEVAVYLAHQEPAP